MTMILMALSSLIVILSSAALAAALDSIEKGKIGAAFLFAYLAACLIFVCAAVLSLK